MMCLQPELSPFHCGAQQQDTPHSPGCCGKTREGGGAPLGSPLSGGSSVGYCALLGLLFKRTRVPSRQTIYGFRASLMGQWLRIHLPMQGTQVQSLVREEPTCRGAAKSTWRKYGARVQGL